MLRKTRACIILADGKPLSPEGYVTLTLDIGGMSVVQEMIVAAVGIEGLIGMDFLRSHHCQFDLRKNQIWINGWKVPLKYCKIWFPML